ncbi:MAG: hypothetical protein NVS3B25_20120 [Hymenobacter sp.]
MPAPSPLAAIYHAIQQVKANVAANAHLFRNNEAATRAGLIDPILRALGWDTTNVRMVEPERMVANKQALDYVLKDAYGSIQSVVEAKKLGESLDKLGHVGAVIGYAFSLKPKSFFITDGLNWHCYSPTHSTFHPVETIDFQHTDLIEAALQLVRWLDAAQGGHGILLAAASPTLPEIQLLPLPTPPRAAGAKAAPATEFIELAHVHLPDLRPGQKPQQLRLPDGAIKPINTWKDILLETCRFVLANNPHIPIPLADKAGKKTFLLSFAKPVKGSSAAFSYNDRPVFITPITVRPPASPTPCMPPSRFQAATSQPRLRLASECRPGLVPCPWQCGYPGDFAPWPAAKPDYCGFTGATGQGRGCLAILGVCCTFHP